MSEMIPIDIKHVTRGDNKKFTMEGLRRKIEKESVNERLINYAKLANGFFSLSSTDLLVLAGVPKAQDDLKRVENTLNSLDFDHEQHKKSMKELKALGMELQEIVAGEKKDVDYKIVKFSKKLQALKKRNRIEVSKQDVKVAGNTSTIGQLEL